MNATRYFKLGLFILAALSVLVAGAITLGAGRMFAKSITVRTSFDESVSGLDVGAPVKHRGVSVGKVQAIYFPADTARSAEPFKHIMVEMKIDSQVVSEMGEGRLRETIDRMVAAGLRARIAQSGLTGGAHVELNYLDPARFPITKPPVPMHDVYIPSAPGSLNQVVDAVTDIATKLQRADLEQVVRHADSLIVHMDQSVQDLHVAELRTKTNAILDNVQSVSAKANELLKNGKFDESAMHLNHTLAEVDDLLATQSDYVRAILSDLRATIANAREMSEDVKANPARLLFGQSPQRSTYGSSK